MIKFFMGYKIRQNFLFQQDTIFTKIGEENGAKKTNKIKKL